MRAAPIRRIALVPAVCLLVVFTGCDEAPAGPDVVTQAAVEAMAVTSNVNGVAHHVSAGSPDICTAIGLSPGCDANFSLTANELPDGSVSGQWEDVLRFFDPPPAFLAVHVAIDCLAVDGNQAWVSGQITQPEGAAGIPVSTRLVDNGQSVNERLDQISTLNVFGPVCTERAELELFDLHEGEVTVR